MLTKLMNANRVAGTRGVSKAVQEGRASLVYIAQDADLIIKNKISALCSAQGVRVLDAQTMKALGQACGLDVGTAAAAILKD